MYESGPTGACTKAAPKANVCTCINCSRLVFDGYLDNKIPKFIITVYLK